MKKQTCTIIGQRPTRFRFKYNEKASDCKRLKKRLEEQIKLLYSKGVRIFWIGGALGVDMWAGEILLRIKEQKDYRELEIHIALPGPEHDKMWDDRSKARMAFLIKHSTECILIGAGLTLADYRRRNQFIVNRADILLAVYDDIRSDRSGTEMMVSYARKKKGIPIILIHPDTACVQEQPILPS